MASRIKHLEIVEVGQGPLRGDSFPKSGIVLYFGGRIPTPLRRLR